MLPPSKLVDFEDNFDRLFRKTQKMMVSAVSASQRIINGESTFEGLLIFNIVEYARTIMQHCSQKRDRRIKPIVIPERDNRMKVFKEGLPESELKQILSRRSLIRQTIKIPKHYTNDDIKKIERSSNITNDKKSNQIFNKKVKLFSNKNQRSTIEPFTSSREFPLTSEKPSGPSMLRTQPRDVNDQPQLTKSISNQFPRKFTQNIEGGQRENPSFILDDSLVKVPMMLIAARKDHRRLTRSKFSECWK